MEFFLWIMCWPIKLYHNFSGLFAWLAYDAPVGGPVFVHGGNPFLAGTLMLLGFLGLAMLMISLQDGKSYKIRHLREDKKDWERRAYVFMLYFTAYAMICHVVSFVAVFRVDQHVMRSFIF